MANFEIKDSEQSASEIPPTKTNTIATQTDMTNTTEINLTTLDKINNPSTSRDTQYIDVNASINSECLFETECVQIWSHLAKTEQNNSNQSIDKFQNLLFSMSRSMQTQYVNRQTQYFILNIKIRRTKR